MDYPLFWSIDHSHQLTNYPMIFLVQFRGFLWRHISAAPGELQPNAGLFGFAFTVIQLANEVSAVSTLSPSLADVGTN
jgi:hypothetical protein